MLLLNQLTSAISQLLIFSALPFIWYAITAKRASGFGEWLGLKATIKLPIKIMVGIFIAFLSVTILPYLWLYQAGNLNYQGFTIDSFRQSGWSLQTILVILIWAIVQTSLSEEILFRGFLCKRLSNRFGQKIGIAIQALIFGVIHILGLPDKNAIAMAVITLLTGGLGYALGWLSLGKANGSILYGWMIHAAANIMSSILVFTFLAVSS